MSEEDWASHKVESETLFVMLCLSFLIVIFGVTGILYPPLPWSGIELLIGGLFLFSSTCLLMYLSMRCYPVFSTLVFIIPPILTCIAIAGLITPWLNCSFEAISLDRQLLNIISTVGAVITIISLTVGVIYTICD